jgi:hypothetical protein
MHRLELACDAVWADGYGRTSSFKEDWDLEDYYSNKKSKAVRELLLAGELSKFQTTGSTCCKGLGRRRLADTGT